jgi:hypothetical protein
MCTSCGTDFQTIFTAAHLNNNAAALLESGDFRGAILQLQLALTPVKHLMKNKCSCNLCSGPVSVVLDHVMAARPPKRQGQDEQHHQGGDYIYGQAIYLPKDLVQESATKYLSRLTIAVAVTFNMALAHQLLATQGGIYRNALLGKAARIYERSFTMFQNHGSDGGTIFVLASLNNLAMIHKASGNDFVASKCFQRLLSMLMILVDRGHEQSAPCFDGFLTNTAHLVSRQTVAAAA